VHNCTDLSIEHPLTSLIVHVRRAMDIPVLGRRDTHSVHRYGSFWIFRIQRYNLVSALSCGQVLYEHTVRGIEHMIDNTHRDEEPGSVVEVTRPGSNCLESAMVIGLTGGIASGKSTVAEMFRELGAEIVSADTLVHRILQEDAAVRSEIVREFGREIVLPNGEIDRKALGRIVFSDEKKRILLEHIIHPKVIAQLERIAREFRRSGRGVLILEIPLLVESKLLYIVDKVIVVSAEQETQIERLMKRDSIDMEAAIFRIDSQMPLYEKARFADWLINSDCAFDLVKGQVYAVWQDILKRVAPRK